MSSRFALIQKFVEGCALLCVPKEAAGSPCHLESINQSINQSHLQSLGPTGGQQTVQPKQISLKCCHDDRIPCNSLASMMLLLLLIVPKHCSLRSFMPCPKKLHALP